MSGANGGPNTLWTPDREVPVGRGVQSATPEDMRILRDMHTVAQKFNIELRCPRCDRSFGGLNNGRGSVESIFCGCREIRAQVRSRLLTL